jgi:predicted molibdopterin-dependent oxidoreductase YjgC
MGERTSGEASSGKRSTVKVIWPNGCRGSVEVGTGWLEAAATADLMVPTACRSGSCGACEIEVNGRIVRACIASVPPTRSGSLTVELAIDPYW